MDATSEMWIERLKEAQKNNYAGFDSKAVPWRHEDIMHSVPLAHLAAMARLLPPDFQDWDIKTRLGTPVCGIAHVYGMDVPESAKLMNLE